MGILPDRFRHDESGVAGNLSENLHPFLLGSDKAMPFGSFHRMSTSEAKSAVRHGFSQRVFHLLLCGPTVLIGRQSQIAIGHQQDFILGGFRYFGQLGNLIFRHACNTSGVGKLLMT